MSECWPVSADDEHPAAARAAAGRANVKNWRRDGFMVKGTGLGERAGPTWVPPAGRPATERAYSEYTSPPFREAMASIRVTGIPLIVVTTRVPAVYWMNRTDPSATSHMPPPGCRLQ